jgi:protein-S-isoprenylcysteine O-methyltransferase Ste14
MTDILRMLIIFGTACLFVQMVVFGSRVRGNALGDAPIAKPAFVLAKIGAAVSFVLMMFAALFRPPRLTTFGAVVLVFLLVAGYALFSLSFSRLGLSLRMGLPREKTALVMSGVYGFSRHPIYVGMYLLMGASLVYAFSWLNVGAVLISVVLHHRIVLAEERFLIANFPEYEAYRNRVRRYL